MLLLMHGAPERRARAGVNGTPDMGQEEKAMAGKAKPGPAKPAPGIVIRGGFEPPRPPRVTAFIWGGKVKPIPAIPYGRRSA